MGGCMSVNIAGMFMNYVLDNFLSDGGFKPLVL